MISLNSFIDENSFFVDNLSFPFSEDILLVENDFSNKKGTFNTSIDDIKTKINKVSSTATLKVTKEGKEITSGKLTTGTVVTITEGNESKSYNVVLYGDINGDGVVNGLDLIKVQKHILGVAFINQN